MKKALFSLILICFTLNNFLSAEKVIMNTHVESVIIYHSGALVSRAANNDLVPGLNELVFKNVSSKIVLSSIKVINKEITILNKSIIRKPTKEEFNELIDKKNVLTKQIALIETKYSDTGFVSNVEELKKMIAYYSNKTLQLKKELRKINKEIKEARKIEHIDFKNKSSAILKLTVSIDKKLNRPFEMQYVCGGIGWSPSYQIIVNSPNDKKIELRYFAKVMSQTGEDWNNTVVKLSSSFPLSSPTKLPKPATPWVLDGGKFNNSISSDYGNKSQYAEQRQKIQKLKGVKYRNINIPSFLKLKTLKGSYSIKSNSTVFTFPILSVSLPAKFFYYSFPSIDPEIYLVAQITGWDTIGFIDGIANITFNGNAIGKSIIKFSETKDTLLLPIGKDNSVFLKRSEIVNQKYFKTTSIGKKKEMTLAYQYELKNNNSFPIKFKLVDQVPISQTKSANIEIEKKSDGNINNQTGEIIWRFNLKPGQTEEKKLIFTIKMDSKYNYYEKRPSNLRFRTISCPSF